MSTLGAGLARFVSGIRHSDIPAEAREWARKGITDCLAVIIAGCREEPPTLLRSAIDIPGTASEAAYLGLTPEARGSAANAAWINGTAAHVLDYDDALNGHPSAVIVPALIAEGEALGASGAELITAYVAGYEVYVELGLREKDVLQPKGWHPTSVFGAIVAAAACAVLRKYDAERTAQVLGLAASQSCGLVSAYGTMAKSVQVGRAPYVALLSSRLTSLGMTCAPEVVDGFMKAISPRGRVDTASDVDLGNDWHIVRHGLNFKRFPVCYLTHRLIDAALQLKESGLNPEDVEHIDASISDISADMLRYHAPDAALPAKFSVEFAVTAALLEGNVTLAETTDAYVRRPEVQAFMRRINVQTNRNYDPEDPKNSLYDELTVTLRDGRTLRSGQIRHALGNARKPLPAEAMRRKFIDCVKYGNPRIDGPKLLGLLEDLEALPDCRALVQAAVA